MSQYDCTDISAAHHRELHAREDELEWQRNVARDQCAAFRTRIKELEAQIDADARGALEMDDHHAKERSFQSALIGKQRKRIKALEEALEKARGYIEYEDEGITYGHHTFGCQRFGDTDECLCGVDTFRAELAALLHPTDDKIEPSPEDLVRQVQEEEME